MIEFEADLRYNGISLKELKESESICLSMEATSSRKVKNNHQIENIALETALSYFQHEIRKAMFSEFRHRT